MEVAESETRSYGMVKIKEPTIGDLPVRVLGTVEKPAPEKAPSRFALIGRYVFSPQIFDYLANTPKGSGGEIQLTDAMNQLCGAEGLHAVKINGCRYDIGNPFFYLKAQIDEGMRRPEIQTLLKEYLKSL
jgi:UTP--glucose-1-phosphate uridylyltransferase